MLLPLSWLSDFIDLTLEPQVLADELTMKGTEVEAIHRYEVDGLVVGAILDVSAHPDADRLVVCRVDIGGGEPSTIVCGAPNVAAGQKVAVAPPGAMLPGGFRLKARKMRGVKSEGMILAEDELGIGDDHDGILVLPSDWEVGADLGRYLPVSDVVLELAITPNRGDCLSLLGIAREIHAITGAPVRMPEMASALAGPAPVEVVIEDPEGCPRYAARVIDGVQVGQSPILWRARLHRAGLRPINAVVDATNITLLELGQPQHAFDSTAFAGDVVRVRASRPGEPFTTLDGNDHELEAGFVMIASDEAPVAIGGVMGGQDSAVTEETTRLVLESAYFDPSRIRKAASRLRLSSDSSYRFERGVDAERVLEAAARTAHLVMAHAGGQDVGGVTDAYPEPVEPASLNLRKSRVDAILGLSVPPAEIQGILQRLGLEPTVESDSWSVRVPTHRHDLEREIDLVEEVARIHGYEKIPEVNRLSGAPPRGLSDLERLQSRLEALLTGAGYAGTVGNSLISPSEIEPFQGPGAPAPPRVRNPLGEDQSLLRPTLLPSLLGVAARNAARGRADVRVFEIATVFEDRGGVHERGNEARFQERPVLALLATGRRSPLHWSQSGQDTLQEWADLTGIVTHVCRGLGLGTPDIEETQLAGFEVGSSARLILDGKTLGRMGCVDRKLSGALDLRSDVFVAEVEVGVMLGAVDETRRFDVPSRFPVSCRDLSLLVPTGLGFAEVRNRIAGVASRQLRSIEAFDVYEGDPVPRGQRSVALRLTYRAQDRTLTDDEVSRSQKKVMDMLSGELGVVVRGLD